MPRRVYISLTGSIVNPVQTRKVPSLVVLKQSQLSLHCGLMQLKMWIRRVRCAFWTGIYTPGCHGSYDVSLQASMRVTNAIPLRCSLPYCLMLYIVQPLKGNLRGWAGAEMSVDGMQEWVKVRGVRCPVLDPSLHSRMLLLIMPALA